MSYLSGHFSYLLTFPTFLLVRCYQHAITCFLPVVSLPALSSAEGAEPIAAFGINNLT
jgi:hypothetical protein